MKQRNAQDVLFGSYIATLYLRARGMSMCYPWPSIGGPIHAGIYRCAAWPLWKLRGVNMGCFGSQLPPGARHSKGLEKLRVCRSGSFTKHGPHVFFEIGWLIIIFRLSIRFFWGNLGTKRYPDGIMAFIGIRKGELALVISECQRINNLWAKVVWFRDVPWENHS